ncbi:MAG: glycoside hydrolase family 3 C-terminal domain-containing protein [Bacteroidetes bacterium]|nr:glycoside hydrolase family 3 C-terminal domain-containing protein [Bacteroidota bacterium]
MKTCINLLHHKYFIKVKPFFFLLLLLVVLSLSFRADPVIRPLYLNPNATVNQRIGDLLKRMTLEEKVGQLSIFAADKENLKELIKEDKAGGTNGMLPGQKNVPAYLKEMQQLAMQSRLKIPLLFMGDVIHGYRTTFPVPLAEACSWSPSLIKMADSISAVEATSAGMNWTFSPMLDIARDPRWGRVVEGAGEDPFLGSAIAAAAVHGFQGNSLSDPHAMMATAKHFAAYGATEDGRDYNTVDMSDRRFREIYLPPFQSAINAGIESIMPAFISFNGVPASENSYLLRDILRKEFGFKGLVVSDFNAIPELQVHGVAANDAEAAEEAINAGMDIDLHSGTYLETLPTLVKEGKVSETTLDAAVRNVLKVKFMLGLFDNPLKYGNVESGYEDKLLLRHRILARKVAERSIVLLKNDRKILPLSKTIKTIAILGPLAKDQKNIIGPVHALGRWQDAVSVWQGIKEKVSPETKLLYAEGTDVNGDSDKGFADAVAAAQSADIVVMVMGESAVMSGEGNSRSKLGLPGNQLDLVKAVMKTGKPVVIVLMNGRPLTINWLNDHVPGILETWFLGIEAGPAIANVLFGDYNPSGKLPITFPRDEGQVPVYYSHLNTGRPVKIGDRYTSHYIDVPNTPLYPFGYGLSYTSFSYSPLSLSTQHLGWNDTLKVSVKLTNTGDRPGTEVAQLYIRDLVASVSRPVKELKGFQRVKLMPGESTTLTFVINRHDLAFYGKDMGYKAEPGDFDVFIGGNSDSVTPQASFALQANQNSK